jgi:leucyl-tRNA synthetase
MFFAKWNQGGPWNYDGIKGPQRLLYDVWEIACHDYQEKDVNEGANRDLTRKSHQVIKKLTEDFESFSFNTAVAALMEMRNALIEVMKTSKVGEQVWVESVDAFLLLLAPITPHIAEELWARRGKPYSIHRQKWPVWDEHIVKEESITLVVQINGKVRDKIEVAAGLSSDELQSIALSSDKIRNWTKNKELRKVIVVKGKLVNIVL